MYRFSNGKRRSFPFCNRRRKFIIAGGMGVLQFALPKPHLLFAKSNEGDFADLHGIIRLTEKTEPILAFNPPDVYPDEEVQQKVMEDVASHTALLERVKAKIGFKQQIHFAIDSLSIQLHYIPELRKPYALAYRKYCKEVTDFIFTRTGHENFYKDFVIPDKAYPILPKSGINAYLIHQLVKKYVVECTFSNESGDSVSYRLKGQFFSSHKGAVNLNILTPKKGEFQLARDQYSLWQNHTDQAFTLFSIPIEETFHYMLGQYTDKEIEYRLYKGKDSFTTTLSVQKMANHWMAVEEAIVGGFVHLFLNEFTKKYSLPITPKDMKARMAMEKGISQYRFRASGIKLVNQMGLKSAFESYAESPSKFLDRLTALG